MKKLTSGKYTLIVSSILVTGISINQEVIAEEIITISTTQKNAGTYPQPGTFSVNFEDLQAKKPLDLDEFCKNYPFNSRCVNRPSSSDPKYEETKTTENNLKTPAKTSGWSVTPEIGTLGIGATITKSITPNINAKVGVNGLDINRDVKISGINYDATLKLFNVSALVDYHPWQKSGFRLTGGLIFQNNNLEGTEQFEAGQTVNLGGREYIVPFNESVKTKVSLPRTIAPYIGIGWGNAVKPGDRWIFSANLGVMFAGSPTVELTAPDYVPPAIVEAERQDIKNQLDWLRIYPVLSIGVSYHF